MIDYCVFATFFWHVMLSKLFVSFYCIFILIISHHYANQNLLPLLYLQKDSFPLDISHFGYGLSKTANISRDKKVRTFGPYNFGPVLRAENRSWAGLGQRQWADFRKNSPLRPFWQFSSYFRNHLKLEIE